MSIAEQMGRTLQKTAISTNIKERLGKRNQELFVNAKLGCS
jgi:N-methylhydantoinase B/oxoprolinase/acetone carboxylase alpha subunit